MCSSSVAPRASTFLVWVFLVYTQGTLRAGILLPHRGSTICENDVAVQHPAAATIGGRSHASAPGTQRRHWRLASCAVTPANEICIPSFGSMTRLQQGGDSEPACSGSESAITGMAAAAWIHSDFLPSTSWKPGLPAINISKHKRQPRAVIISITRGLIPSTHLCGRWSQQQLLHSCTRHRVLMALHILSLLMCTERHVMSMPWCYCALSSHHHVCTKLQWPQPTVG